MADHFFAIFVEDSDRGLSNREFVDMMKNKLKRSPEKPKDTRLINLISTVTKCTAKSTMPQGKRLNVNPAVTGMCDLCLVLLASHVSVAELLLRQPKH